MTPETTTLQRVFTNLSALLGSDLEVSDWGSVGDEGVTLSLRRQVYIGCGDYETHSHYIAFTWDELIEGNDLHEVALSRWAYAQAATEEEAKRIKRASDARDAAEAKRTRAASKGARTKRELATLHRLAKKHGVTLQDALE